MQIEEFVHISPNDCLNQFCNLKDFNNRILIAESLLKRCLPEKFALVNGMPNYITEKYCSVMRDLAAGITKAEELLDIFRKINAKKIEPSNFFGNMDPGYLKTVTKPFPVTIDDYKDCIQFLTKAKLAFARTYSVYINSVEGIKDNDLKKTIKQSIHSQSDII